MSGRDCFSSWRFLLGLCWEAGEELHIGLRNGPSNTFQISVTGQQNNGLHLQRQRGNAKTEPKHCVKELPEGPDGTLLLVCFRGSLGPVRHFDRNHLEFYGVSEARDETPWTFNSSRMSLHQSRMVLPNSAQVARNTDCFKSESEANFIKGIFPLGVTKRADMFITPHEGLDHPCNWSEPRPSWIPMMSSCHGFCFRLCVYLRFGNGNHELQVEATNSVRFATVACGLMRSDSLTQYIKHHLTTSFRTSVRVKRNK